jgi:hypothetical protein
MQAKTIEIIIKVAEIIADIFLSKTKNKPGGKKHDSARSGKKKREGSGTQSVAS